LGDDSEFDRALAWLHWLRAARCLDEARLRACDMDPNRSAARSRRSCALQIVVTGAGRLCIGANFRTHELRFLRMVGCFAPLELSFPNSEVSFIRRGSPFLAPEVSFRRAVASFLLREVPFTHSEVSFIAPELSFA
jgi:hypothetical protein